VRKHREEEADPKGRVFGRESDAYVSVRPCAKGEPVCADERTNAGEPFFFWYTTIFKWIKLRLPLMGFERALLTEINVAPAQLHPNSWAFVRAFVILCNHSGCWFLLWMSLGVVFIHLVRIKVLDHRLKGRLGRLGRDEGEVDG